MSATRTAFCGSSSESLRIVHELQSQLSDTVKIKPWKGLIRPGDYVLERLLSLIDTFDYGIFVFTADDTIEIRKKRYLVSRDNVILELGLFMERFGRHRTLLVVQDIPNLHLPTDLEGLVVTKFRLPPAFSPPKGQKVANIPPSDLTDALVSSVHQLRNAILEQTEIKLPGALSGGMVYLLRHLTSTSRSSSALVPALMFFQASESAELSATERQAWKKATQYACQALIALGLVESIDGARYLRITEQGRRLLASRQIKDVFGREMKKRKFRFTTSSR